MWRFLRAWTCVVLHGRREAGKRSAQAWKLSGEVCVSKAAMHVGIVIQYPALLPIDSRMRGFEVKDESEKVVLGDTEDSKLEVRGGYS